MKKQLSTMYMKGDSLKLKTKTSLTIIQKVNPEEPLKENGLTERLLNALAKINSKIDRNKKNVHIKMTIG